MSKTLSAALMAPYSSAAAVDLSSADVTFTSIPRALYIGASGDVVVKLMGNSGASVTFKAVPVGILPVLPGTVVKTGTTATNILALR